MSTPYISTIGVCVCVCVIHGIPYLYSVSEKTDQSYHYNCYGCVVTEVEVDTLTGETSILRADILYDCGDR